MRAAKRMPLPDVKESITRFGPAFTRDGRAIPGGLDQVTPTLSVQSGSCQNGSVNFQIGQAGGYVRIDGYERYSGLPSPSDASYVIVQVSSFTSVPDVGDDIVQAGSGATGTVALVVSTNPYYMVVTKVVGTFNYTGAISSQDALHITSANAPYSVAAHSPPVHIPISTAIGTAITPTIFPTSQQNAQYLAAAADIYRADIEPVPGGGPILGILAMNVLGSAEVYAFRGTEDETMVRIYRATTSGWTLVPFYNVVNFTTGGGGVPDDGETLIQGAVTATILRVMTRSGELWTGASTGGFVVTNPTGGGFGAGAATLSGGSTVVLTGGITPITLLGGGKFQFTEWNFGGAETETAAYGCDGVNKAFEFKNNVLAPITTGLDVDAPSEITNHTNHLFVAYKAGIYWSCPGLPFNWTDAGADALATGSVVTGMITLPTGANTATLAVYQRLNTGFLYGSGNPDWNLVQFNTGIGALQYSLQNLYDTYVLDDSGILVLKTTLNWGNFQPEVLTRQLQPFINQEANLVSASLVNHDRNQYRLFFSNGYGLYATIINQQYYGSMPVLFPNPVNCADHNGTPGGTEVSYFGSTDGNGYVYQLDRGTSFDGENIAASIVAVWDAMRSPLILKRYRALSIEVASSGYGSLSFGYQLGFNSPLINQPTAVSYDTNFAPAPAWDTFIWDAFVWDGATLVPTYVPMLGDGQNVSISLSTNANYIPSFALNSATFQYTPRRRMRI